MLLIMSYLEVVFILVHIASKLSYRNIMDIVSFKNGALINAKQYLRQKSANRIYEELYNLQENQKINFVRLRL